MKNAVKDTSTLPPMSSGHRPKQPFWRRHPRWTIAAAAVVVFGVGAAIGTLGQKTVVKHVAGPAIVKTVNVPGPTVYKTKTVKVPGPTVYKTRTVYAPATQGPTGTTIASYSGTGNQVTGSFTVPSSGDYIVAWRYWGNNDCSLGSCSASNFSISDTNTGGLPGNTPNDIASSGSGSTEDTGMSGGQSFNVGALGSWTITVKSAP